MLAKSLNLGQNTAHIRNSARYIVNDAKTHGDGFVTYQNCTPDTAALQMELLNNQRNYLEGKALKGGCLDYLLMHEVGNEELTEERAKELHERDIDNFKKYLKSQGKNPENYVFLAGSHLETGRVGTNQRGYFHTEFLVSRFDITDIKAPMIRNSRNEWDALSKFMINAYPEEVKIKQTWREKIKEDIDKGVKNKDINIVHNFTNPKELEGLIQNPYQKVLCHTSYKRKWETIISDTNLNYFQRREALLKCDIDDSIETIKENYQKGIIKELNFKSFTNEMNQRGYSYRQTDHTVSFNHKNWNADDKGKKNKVERIKSSGRGYKKDDIIKRIDGTMQFEPDHPLVMVWNDIEKMPNDRKLRKQAEYINQRNANRCFKIAKAVDYIFGGGIGGLLLALMVIFILVATKPKLQDIYKGLYNKDFEKRREGALLQFRNDFENVKNEVYDKKWIESPEIINIQKRVMDLRDNNYNTEVTLTNVLKFQKELKYIQKEFRKLAKNEKTESVEASQSNLELNKRTTTHEIANHEAKKQIQSTEISQKVSHDTNKATSLEGNNAPEVAGFATSVPNEEVAGLATSDSVSAGFAETPKVDNINYDGIKSLAKECIENAIYELNKLVETRDTFPKNSIQRKELNKEILDEYPKVEAMVPNFKKYLSEDLKLDFKAKNIISHWEKWFDNVASFKEIDSIAKKYNRLSYFELQKNFTPSGGGNTDNGFAVGKAETSR